MSHKRLYLFFLLGFVIIIGMLCACRMTKNEEISTQEEKTDIGPTILFINLRFFNPENEQAEVVNIFRTKGNLKEEPAANVTVPVGGYRCSFIGEKGESHGQYAINSPLEEYMETSDKNGSLERVLVKKEEIFIPLRITDNQKIHFLLLEKNVTGNFEPFAKFDLKTKK